MRTPDGLVKLFIIILLVRLFVGHGSIILGRRSHPCLDLLSLGLGLLRNLGQRLRLGLGLLRGLGQLRHARVAQGFRLASIHGLRGLGQLVRLGHEGLVV